MQKVYRNTSILIFLIWIGIQWGFYQSYTSQFPKFPNITLLIHVHGALLMTWLLLLIVQPLLIQSGKASLHRKIGLISWVLGPLIIISLFLIGKNGYHRGLAANNTEHDMLTFIVLDMRGFLTFAIFWTLAMGYRKISQTHMRYMIATGVLGIGPGVARGVIASFGWDIWDAITLTDVMELLIIGTLLAFDIYKKKNYKPFLTVFLILLVGKVLWQIRDSAFWQSFAKMYAGLFY